MADDVEQQVVAEILGAPLNKFPIQLDESTDVSNCAQLLVFARYIKDGEFKEEFLFCHCSETATKGEDVFQQVFDYFERMGLFWKNVSGCTTDAVLGMLGINSGFRAWVETVNPFSKHNHCMIHRYALASKILPSDLKLVLEDAVTMVNYIMSSALNTRVFRLLCQELDIDHQNLLFYTEFRWFSRWNML
ncbi:Zinc finger protein [Oopsacas minuta]|uniref:Zinc finger protein n=1 Tax=Oopsacas minuta TaxID=111878 RepID=A0AAV7JXZ4_9METZ|nr:Zinc finger protein [Oopsacas minuta]